MSSRPASSTSLHFRTGFAAILFCVLARADACDVMVPVTRLRPEADSYTQSSGLDEPAEILVRDENRWSAVWQQIHGHTRPSPPLPDIDFGKEMVIAVAMGRQRSGGYEIRIDRAWQERGVTVIVVRRYEPAAGCILPAAITSPADIARLPSAPDPVEFRLESVTRDCD